MTTQGGTEPDQDGVADGGPGIDLVRLAAGAVGNGVVWSPDETTDLNVNLVHLEPLQQIGEHVNGEVEVFVLGIAGTGTVVIDGRSVPVGPMTLVRIPRGAARSLAASATPLSYLSLHRRRAGLQLRPRQ